MEGLFPSVRIIDPRVLFDDIRFYINKRREGLLNMLKVKNFFKGKRNDISIFNSIFMLLLLYSMVRRMALGYTKEDWNIAEWLINYRGGFVRRGLTGQALFDLYNHFGLSPYTVILLISGLAFVGLAVFFMINFRKKGSSLSILLYPFFLGGLIINNIWARKDVVIVLIFILLIYLVTENFPTSKKTGTGILKLFALNVAFSLGLLIHEELGFLAFPILFLIFFNSLKERFSTIKCVLLSILKLIPSLIIFSLCVYYKGSVTASNLIWNSWKPVPFPFQDMSAVPPSAIGALSWSLQRGLSLTVDTIKNFDGGIYAPIAWVLIIAVIFYLLSHLNIYNSEETKVTNNEKTNQYTKTNISSILIFQLLFIIPLFILGWDYARWIFLWVTTSFSLLILLPDEKLATLFPKFLVHFSEKVDCFLSSIFRSIRSRESYFIVLLFLGVPSYSWTLEEYTHSTPIYFVIANISNFIYMLGKAVIPLVK